MQEALPEVVFHYMPNPGQMTNNKSRIPMLQENS